MSLTVVEFFKWTSVPPANYHISVLLETFNLFYGLITFVPVFISLLSSRIFCMKFIRYWHLNLRSH